MLAMPKAIQKICFHGNSANVTLPRHILYALEWRPGDLLDLRTDLENGCLIIRPFFNKENDGVRSPGVVPEPPAVSSK